MKTPLPKRVTELGIEIDFKLVQSLKALSSILVIELGIEIEVRLEQPDKK